MILNGAIIFLLIVVISGVSAARHPYTAAAYEHARFGKLIDPPKLVVDTNLEKYVRAAEIAAAKGADIIVFPEYGIFYPGNRTQLKFFLEDIPDPKKVQTNPCEEKEKYSQRPILYALSCIAKNYSIFVVANTGDIKNCSGESDCPKDGVFHFNTNVVFDRDGTLQLRYYKEHLFFELGMDLAKEQQNPTFKTDFGTFATYICFDIIFKRMSEVSKWPQVDGVMFSTMWVDVTPQYVSVPFFQGWAMGNNATIVVSNIQIPGLLAVGSGIFDRQYGSLGYTFSPDGISKLVIAKVPGDDQPESSNFSITAFTDTKIWDFNEDGETVPKVCSRTLLNGSSDPMSDYRCLDENTTNYTLVKITKPSGIVKACNNGVCCSVHYSAESMMEDFYLGIYNGTYNSFNKYYWCQESCFLARCDRIENRTCTTFPRRANTIFHHVELISNFSTQYIYPSVVSSKSRLVSLTDWDFNVSKRSAYESSIHFHSKPGESLITVGLNARCYERDPPYVR